MKAHQPMPNLAAERMRRHRQRRRNGLRCFTVELRETEIDILIREGLLKAEMRNHSSAIIEALYEFYMTHGISVVTHNSRPTRLTIEKLAVDCLDVRDLRRVGALKGGWKNLQ